MEGAPHHDIHRYLSRSCLSLLFRSPIHSYTAMRTMNTSSRAPLVPPLSALLLLLLFSPPVLVSSSAARTSKTRRSLRNDPYALLSSAILDRISTFDVDYSSPSASTFSPTFTDAASVRSALKSLSSAQSALKGIDGASHELYQRTHKSASSELQEEDTGPAGRAARSAARLGCVADGLFAAELCELVENPDDAVAAPSTEDTEEEELDNTLSLEDREVWLNKTCTCMDDESLTINVLVLYELKYNGGAGCRHGGIDGVLKPSDETDPPPRGRLLVVLKDEYGKDLPATISTLDVEQRMISLDPDGLAAEAGLPSSARMASVSGPLYDAAGKVLEIIRPALERAEKEVMANKSDEAPPKSRPPPPFAIHFVGRSLAGGVAALAATIMDGILPFPVGESEGEEDDSDTDEEEAATKIKSFCGYGRGRASAFALGPPPCLSNNIKADFVKSIIHGDDAICRTTRESLDRLCQRTRRVMKGNVLGAKIGWMSNTLALTVSGVKTHAKGKKGGEKHLSVPGMVYLVRPRRYEGSSIHEVTSSDGAIKVRSAVLWQLNDVLLSKSLWAHHSLSGYIRGLDRVQLRSIK